MDKNTIFALNGDSYRDSSLSDIEILKEGEIPIENDLVFGKCLNFCNSSRLFFTLDTGFLAGDFTVEWWEYDTNIASGNLSSVFTNMTSSGRTSIGFPTLANNRCIFNVSSSGSGYFKQNYKYGDSIENEWVHRALVVKNKVWSFYQNGKLYTSFEWNDTPYPHNTAFQIGRWRASSDALLKKVCRLKVSNIARYDSDFVPSKSEFPKRPVISPDSISHKTIVVVDKLQNKGVTLANIVNNGITLSEDGKFGEGMDLTKDDAYAVLTLDTFNADTNWTIDWWEKDIDVSKSVSTALFSSSSARGIYIGATAGNANRNLLYLSSGSTFDVLSAFKFGDNIEGEWVHRAIVKDGNEIRAYQNGKLYAKTFITKSIKNITSYNLNRYGTSAPKGIGKLVDNFRITQDILYTEDFAPYESDLRQGVMNIKIKNTHIEVATKEVGVLEKIKLEVDGVEKVSIESPKMDVSIPMPEDIGFGEHKYRLASTINGIEIEDVGVYQNITLPTISDEASLEEIKQYNDQLAEAMVLLRNKIKANLDTHGVGQSQDRLVDLADSILDIQSNFELVDVILGDSAYLGVPKPVLDMDIKNISLGSKEVSFKNSKFKGRVFGDTQINQESGVYKTDGQNWIDVNYPIGNEGSIVINFTADESRASNIYARVFRGNTDGVSMFWKQASNTYDIKIYSGAYLAVAPEAIEGKRVVITWSERLQEAKVYADGVLLQTKTLDASKMTNNHSLYIGDNNQKDNGAIPFYMPMEIKEFKVFDCYLSEEMVREV